MNLQSQINIKEFQVLEKSNRKLVAICGLIIICLLVSNFATSLHGSEKYYEIRPEITVPTPKTDIQRVIDSYDHVMNNYFDLMEKNTVNLHSDVTDMAQKIDSIDQKITSLSIQMQSIQKKLGIEISNKNNSNQTCCSDNSTQKNNTQDTGL